MSFAASRSVDQFSIKNYSTYALVNEAKKSILGCVRRMVNIWNVRRISVPTFEIFRIGRRVAMNILATDEKPFLTY